MAEKHSTDFGFFYQSPPSVYSLIKFIPVSCTDLTTCIRGLYSFKNDQPTFLDSCNGLLLSHFLQANTNTSSYIVCNPTMRQQVLLPPSPSGAEGKAVLQVHGFVFNEFDNFPYFEVIRVLQGHEGLIVSTFSSITFTWRTKNHKLSFLHHSNLNLEGVGVRCNGSLHWLCSPLGVVAYNVEKEQFSLIQLPGANNGKLLKESKGYLFYIEINENYICSSWILADYGTKRWCLGSLVDMKSLPSLDVILPYDHEEIYSRILGFDPLDSSVVFVRVNRRIVSYNLESREVKEIHRLDEDEVEGFHVCTPYKVMDCIPKECYSKVLRTPCGSQKKSNMGKRTKSIGRLWFY